MADPPHAHARRGHVHARPALAGGDAGANAGVAGEADPRHQPRGRQQRGRLGNEPELYGTFAWYTRDGQPVPGRPADYDFADFTSDFSRISRTLPRLALAGPSIGVPTPVPRLGQFLAAEPRLGLASFHAYPLLECFTDPSSPRYPTIPRLLAPSSSTGLADSLAGYVATARSDQLALRVDEMNTVGCGAAPGVSNTFATALWALDASFAMAQVGVAGINIHTYPGSTSQLFSFTRKGRSWSASVEPEYYGLEMFAQAAPPGSVLLSTASNGTDVRAWATRATDGTVRVVLINDAGGRRVVAVRSPISAATATLVQLLAPSVGAQSGVTLGGQGFGRRTTTGLPAGRARVAPLAPIRRDFVVTLPPTSAALLTLARGR
ncbi:MAG: glycosyl hydrolase family 79 C-terminal domain-containing protein [Solirubrobacteraceae bacterium]